MSESTIVRTCTVSAGDIATTDFDLTEVQKRQLLRNGRHAASKFLNAFDRANYRNTYGRRLALSGDDDLAPPA